MLNYAFCTALHSFRHLSLSLFSLFTSAPSRRFCHFSLHLRQLRERRDSLSFEHERRGGKKQPTRTTDRCVSLFACLCLNRFPPPQPHRPSVPPSTNMCMDAYLRRHSHASGMCQCGLQCRFLKSWWEKPFPTTTSRLLFPLNGSTFTLTLHTSGVIISIFFFFMKSSIKINKKKNNWCGNKATLVFLD